MKKRILYLLCVLFFAVCLILTMMATDGILRLIDDADLLTDSEEVALSVKLDEISIRQNLDVVIMTVNSTDERTVTEYADDTYDYGGYAESGILLLISMDEREFAISTAGFCITAFTDAGIDYLTDQFTDQMSDGAWSEAFHRFADLCDEFITQARNDTPYNIGSLPSDHLPEKPFKPFVTGLVSLGIGFVIAFLNMNRWKNQLCSVLKKAEAKDYMKDDSLSLTEQRDLYLYRTVDRRKKPESSAGGSSTHTSSSGSMHGGTSGKF